MTLFPYTTLFRSEENSKTDKRDLSSSSSLNENEEGSSAKRPRVLMNAKRYRELFVPRTKINKPSHKRDLSSNSPLNEKEEGSSAKRPRVLMKAKRYKELFMHPTKTNKSSPTGIYRSLLLLLFYFFFYGSKSIYFLE